MPISIRSKDGATNLKGVGFPNEAALEQAIVDDPNLLRMEGGSPLAFVARQVTLPDAGTMDLLLVTADGLPVAVEVKLGANSQSRREVVAQVVDYVSSLTTLTNEELDEITQGALAEALRTCGDEEGEDAFKRRWQALGANLRASLARVVLVLDDTPPSLERIVRFLAENSQLDVQLVEVERYEAAGMGDVVASTFVVGAESARSPAPGTQDPYPELLEAVRIYNTRAPADLQAVGIARYYRQIRLKGWPSLVHYEFYQTKGYLGAELHIEHETARGLAPSLQRLVGHTVANGRCTLLWDPNWSGGLGRLTARFPYPIDAQGAAQAMTDLLGMTRDLIDAPLRELAKKRA